MTTYNAGLVREVWWCAAAAQAGSTAKYIHRCSHAAKDPADGKALENLAKINETLIQLNEQHGCPKDSLRNSEPLRR